MVVLDSGHLVVVAVTLLYPSVQTMDLKVEILISDDDDDDNDNNNNYYYYYYNNNNNNNNNNSDVIYISIVDLRE